MAFHTEAINSIRQGAQGFARPQQRAVFDGFIDLVNDAVEGVDRGSADCDIEDAVDSLLALNDRIDVLLDMPRDARGEFTARDTASLEAFERFERGIHALIPLATLRLVENINGRCACKLPLPKSPPAIF